MCLFSTSINKIRVTTIISQQHFICLPLKVYINKSIFGKILSGIRKLSKLFQFLIKLFPKMVFQIVITCIHLCNPTIFFTHNTQHYRVCCSGFVVRCLLFVVRGLLFVVQDSWFDSVYVVRQFAYVHRVAVTAGLHYSLGGREREREKEMLTHLHIIFYVK